MASSDWLEQDGWLLVSRIRCAGCFDQCECPFLYHATYKRAPFCNDLVKGTSSLWCLHSFVQMDLLDVLVCIALTIFLFYLSKPIVLLPPQRHQPLHRETISESQDDQDTSRLTLDNFQTPYNEDEIVSLVTELYELLVKLAYIDRDHIAWPPPGGHAINEDLCRELRVAPEVISLLKRLPYVDENCPYSLHLFPNSEPLSYLQDSDVERSRDPSAYPDSPRRDYILPHDIPLTGPGDEGPYLLLDIRESTVFSQYVA